MRRLTLQKKTDEQGFTLIEVLTVVVLMGILMLLVVPNVKKSDETLSENLFVSQFDSVFQKATKDARALGEPVEIELQEHAYQIYSSKPNREIRYPHGAKIDSSDIGKRIFIDRKGMVRTQVVVRFEYAKTTYEITVNPGYKKALVNGKSLDEWKKGGGDE